MIRIRVRRHVDGLEISARGHAGYAKRGEDIVCAGVSALLFGFLHHLVMSHSPSAEADGAAGASRSPAFDGSGDRRTWGAEATLPALEYRMEEGALWIRTHGMDGADSSAWAVTRAGLALLERDYPAHVRLTEDARSADHSTERKKPHEP